MYKKASEEQSKNLKSDDFLNKQVVTEQFYALEMVKEPIRKAINLNISRKEKIRMIESKSARTVHFLFNTGQPVTITPFARKYLKLLDGSLKAFEEEEREKFAEYINAIESETLFSDGSSHADDFLLQKHHPIRYEPSPFFTCELSGLNRLAFAVADDPFFKTARARYYPEIVVVNSKGEVKARIGGGKRLGMEKYGKVMSYDEDFREP